MNLFFSHIVVTLKWGKKFLKNVLVSEPRSFWDGHSFKKLEHKQLWSVAGDSKWPHDDNENKAFLSYHGSVLIHCNVFVILLFCCTKCQTKKLQAVFKDAAFFFFTVVNKLNTRKMLFSKDKYFINYRATDPFPSTFFFKPYEPLRDKGHLFRPLSFD